MSTEPQFFLPFPQSSFLIFLSYPPSLGFTQPPPFTFFPQLVRCQPYLFLPLYCFLLSGPSELTPSFIISILLRPSEINGPYSPHLIEALSLVSNFSFCPLFISSRVCSKINFVCFVSPQVIKVYPKPFWYPVSFFCNC